APHGHEDLVGVERGRAAALDLEREHRALALLFPALGFRFEHDLNTQLFELLRHDLYAIGLYAGQNRRKRFNHRDLGTELTVRRAKLAPDDPASHHDQTLGNFGERQGARGIDHALAVERKARNLDRARTGRDDHALGLDTDGRAVRLLDVEG